MMVLLLMVALAAPARATEPVERIADKFQADVAWIGAGTAADLYSTSAALRWCPACRESNPVGWDTEARISLKLGTGIAATSTCWWLRRSGHPKGATIVRWVVFGIQAAAATNNAVHAIRGR